MQPMQGEKASLNELKHNMAHFDYLENKQPNLNNVRMNELINE
jgi:hypothetical protein